MMRRTVSAAAGIATGGAVIYTLTYIGATVNGLALALAGAAGVLMALTASKAWRNIADAHHDIDRMFAGAEAGTAARRVADDGFAERPMHLRRHRHPVNRSAGRAKAGVR